METVNTSVSVLEETDQGPILEIAFKGVHKDGVGHDMMLRTREEIERHRPSAVIPPPAASRAGYSPAAASSRSHPPGPETVVRLDIDI